MKNWVPKPAFAIASIALLLLWIPLEARDLGMGVVERVDPNKRTISMTAYDEEPSNFSVAPDCRITLNGKSVELARLLRWDRVMAYKKGHTDELISLDLARPYDEAHIGKIIFSTGTALAPDMDRNQLSVMDASGEYSGFSFSAKTEIWDRTGQPRRIQAKEIKTGDLVSIKHRFFFPASEALVISIWKHKIKSTK